METLLRNLRMRLISLTVITFMSAYGPAAKADEPSPGVVEMEKIEVLDLQTAARITLEENPSLAAARARVGQAHEAVRQARASYWPRLDLTARRPLQRDQLGPSLDTRLEHRGIGVRPPHG